MVPGDVRHVKAWVNAALAWQSSTRSLTLMNFWTRSGPCCSSSPVEQESSGIIHRRAQKAHPAITSLKLCTDMMNFGVPSTVPQALTAASKRIWNEHVGNVLHDVGHVSNVPVVPILRSSRIQHGTPSLWRSYLSSSPCSLRTAASDPSRICWHSSTSYRTVTNPLMASNSPNAR